VGIILVGLLGTDLVLFFTVFPAAANRPE